MLFNAQGKEVFNLDFYTVNPIPKGWYVQEYKGFYTCTGTEKLQKIQDYDCTGQKKKKAYYTLIK